MKWKGEFPGKRMWDALMANSRVDTMFGEHMHSPGVHVPLLTIPLVNSIKESVVFNIDNVAKYLYEVSDQEIWNIKNDFPVMMAPFQNMWMEYSFPREFNSCELGRLITTSSNRVCKRLGIHVLTLPSKKHKDFPYAQHLTLFYDSLYYKPKDTISGFITWEWLLDKNGRAEFYELDQPRYSFPSILPEYITDDFKRDTSKQMTFLFPAMLAMCFMNCHKTTLVNHVPDPKLNKIHQANGHPPLVTFKTLDIKPVREILKREAGEHTDIKKALHICRGHFKDYTGKGLFGKLKGMYWWGPQIRGTSERGAVVKDYSVSAR